MSLNYSLVMSGVLKVDNKILILKRDPNSTTNSNRWELPGGKIKTGEDFDTALVREFIEETGLKIQMGDLVSAVQEDFPHKKTITLVMNVSVTPNINNTNSTNDINNFDIKISDEHIGYKWVEIDEIKELEVSGWFNKLLTEKELWD